MLSRDQYLYLDRVIRENSTLRTRQSPYPIADGHVPEHNWCQLTALHLERSQGWNAQIGIQWVDKSGVLLPWPHMVNWNSNVLTDYSNPVSQRKLAFTLVGNDYEMYNKITLAISGYDADWPASAQVDPFMSRLNNDWCGKLTRFSAGNAAIFDPAVD